MTLAFFPANDPSQLPSEADAGAFAAEIAEIAGKRQVPPWCSYIVRREGKSVGFGGFKGPPDHAGEVEIGYLTFASAEGGGIASAFAAWLVDLARAEGATSVIGHTLPQSNASTRVLEKAGFSRDGWGEDDEIGKVWRWRCTLRAKAG